jgi:hypothetical protein
MAKPVDHPGFGYRQRGDSFKSYRAVHFVSPDRAAVVTIDRSGPEKHQCKS